MSQGNMNSVYVCVCVCVCVCVWMGGGRKRMKEILHNSVLFDMERSWGGRGRVVRPPRAGN